MEPAEYQRMYDLEDHHWWFQGRLETVRRLLSRHVPARRDPSFRLLDIGCGTGMFLQRQEASADAFGLDFSLQALRFTRSRGAARLVCADSQHLPFLSSQFDMVTAFDLIEHVDGDNLLVAEAHRVLKPGGWLLASVPAHPALWGPHDQALHHKRRYRWSEFSALFPDSIWERIRMTYTFAGIYPAAALVRSARNLLPRRGEALADTNLTPAWLNGLLLAYHRLEAAAVERINLPFGLSITILLKKRG